MGNTRKAEIATGGKQCGTERNSTTKARAMNELSEELETPEGERKIYISDNEGQGFHQDQSDKGRTLRSSKGPG